MEIEMLQKSNLHHISLFRPFPFFAAGTGPARRGVVEWSLFRLALFVMSLRSSADVRCMHANPNKCRPLLQPASPLVAMCVQWCTIEGLLHFTFLPSPPRSPLLAKRVAVSGLAALTTSLCPSRLPTRRRLKARLASAAVFLFSLPRLPVPSLLPSFPDENACKHDAFDP